MKYFKTLKLIAMLFLSFTASVFAQGSLIGTITDSTTNDALIGANVILLNTSFGGATNLEGEYRITRIPVGTYSVKVSYIGYNPKTIQLTIVEGKTLSVDFELTPDVYEGETVTITAQAQGQAAAINQQLSSNTIVNVVSAEKIQELPDANAAESIGRLPGVSLIRSGGEASRVILRGMSDQYTSVTIDGVSIPSTDSLSRGVDLSTISQGSLAGIELYKALTSDKDGDAIAGSINLVTKKAPSKRELHITLLGGYNNLMNSFKQYNLSLRYGERFFDDILGVQATGNFEHKIRSNERSTRHYNISTYGSDYYIDNFILEFNDEIRTRNGGSILLDFNTPDKGVVKLNTVYNSTKRDYLYHSRNYPNGNPTQNLGGVSYQYRDREQEISSFSSALSGENHLIGFDITWGANYSQSKHDFPYDYEMIFSEAAPTVLIDDLHDHPERLIKLSKNNFSLASLTGARYRNQYNFDKDKSLFLNFVRDYNITNDLTGTLKFGGKYKTKSRNNSSAMNYSPYYLGYWSDYELLPGATTTTQKRLAGSYFDSFWQGFLADPFARSISLSAFLDNPVKSRNVEDIYSLNPLINRDKLRQWYDLNKYGVTKNGKIQEYPNDPSAQVYYYDITESVSSGYMMNTFNIGQNLIFIAGVRVEQENNDYKNKYSFGDTDSFPVSKDASRDTSSTYSETIVLPNFQFNIKVTDFLNIRLAAYKALARPDFNMRLNSYFAPGQLLLGNPILKTAKAWNFEINTSFYGNDIGLIGVSAFYKEIKDMYHLLDGISTKGNNLIESLGLGYKTVIQGNYDLTVPYNSPKPTKVWGLEFEHQISFRFLPGLLKNIVLGYNFSLVKSETWLITQVTDTVLVSTPGFPIPVKQFIPRAAPQRQQLENQPRFFGNISLGYDIAGFSGRISLFHQSEYPSSFSPTGVSNSLVAEITRIDLALKQVINEHVSIILNINNLTNSKDEHLSNNTYLGFKLLTSSESYGRTADFGIKIDL